MLVKMIFFLDFINTLPNTIKYFEFDDKFNLPENLTHLILGKYFNQYVDNLPITLKKITLHKSFKNIPPNVKKISFVK